MVGARSGAKELTIRHEDVTESLAGALATDVVDNVSLAAESVSKIARQSVSVNAATDAHTTERRRFDSDHVTLTGTARTERLQLTVLSTNLYHSTQSDMTSRNLLKTYL